MTMRCSTANAKNTSLLGKIKSKKPVGRNWKRERNENFPKMGNNCLQQEY